MSHSKIRAEKICLNCRNETTGRYCPACGQENIEPKQSVWHILKHIFSDITHFDGKFFITVKDLFKKPGFLSKEHMEGRRVSYLDPIRMYIFTSAIFFLIFFSLVNIDQMIVEGKGKSIYKDPKLRALIADAKSSGDSARILRQYLATGHRDISISEDSNEFKPRIKFNSNSEYHSVPAYDSDQLKLPPSRRDGWLRRKYMIRKIVIDQRLRIEKNGLVKEWINHFFHSFPQVLFISLPVFALILKLLYIRRNFFYYVDHGIFSVHLYIFSFLVLMLFFLLNAFRKYTGWNWLWYPEAALLVYPLIYYYKAMRLFYGQRRGKTIAKYLLLLILSYGVQILIFVLAFIFSMVEV